MQTRCGGAHDAAVVVNLPCPYSLGCFERIYGLLDIAYERCMYFSPIRRIPTILYNVVSTYSSSEATSCGESML